MSAVEYNSLLFEISQRLDELNVGRKLLVMCRGKVAPRGEDNMQEASVFSLFLELEQNGFLGRDNLEVLKDMLKGVNEWSLFESVKKFESKRKEYNALLEKIALVLDELNGLERIIAVCRGTIAEERQDNIHNVRSLFKELEINSCLGINRLGILKEILTQTEKNDLLKEVEEFEERRSREDEFERRKGTNMWLLLVMVDILWHFLCENNRTITNLISHTEP